MSSLAVRLIGELREIELENKYLRRLRVTDETLPGRVYRTAVGLNKFDIWVHPKDWGDEPFPLSPSGSLDGVVELFGTPVVYDELEGKL